MSRQIVAGQWALLRDAIRARWDRLTDEDLGRVAGNTEEFTRLIGERYGIPQEEAEQQVADFVGGFDPTDIQPHS